MGSVCLLVQQVVVCSKSLGHTVILRHDYSFYLIYYSHDAPYSDAKRRGLPEVRDTNQLETLQ